MPGFIKCISRYFGFYFHKSFLLLPGFRGNTSWLDFPGRNSSKPFLRKFFYLVNRHFSGDDQNGVVRNIVMKEKILHIIQGCIFDMADLLSDRSPLVRMRMIGERSEFQPNITIGLIE